MDFTPPRPRPEQKRARELLTRSRELLKQMLAGTLAGPPGFENMTDVTNQFTTGEATILARSTRQCW